MPHFSSEPLAAIPIFSAIFHIAVPAGDCGQSFYFCLLNSLALPCPFQSLSFAPILPLHPGHVLTGLWLWACFPHRGPVPVITAFSLVAKSNWVKLGSIWLWLYKWPDLVWASVSSRQEWTEQLDVPWLSCDYFSTLRRHCMEISRGRWGS